VPGARIDVGLLQLGRRRDRAEVLCADGLHDALLERSGAGHVELGQHAHPVHAFRTFAAAATVAATATATATVASPTFASAATRPRPIAAAYGDATRHA